MARIDSLLTMANKAVEKVHLGRLLLLMLRPLDMFIINQEVCITAKSGVCRLHSVRSLMGLDAIGN